MSKKSSEDVYDVTTKQKLKFAAPAVVTMILFAIYWWQDVEALYYWLTAGGAAVFTGALWFFDEGSERMWG